jgi:hypothetical protein
MITNTKIALAAAFLLGAASTALANDVETNPSESTITCPTLEGYPDCHPDGRASWTLYSTNPRRPVTDPSRHLENRQNR